MRGSRLVIQGCGVNHTRTGFITIARADGRDRASATSSARRATARRRDLGADQRSRRRLRRRSWARSCSRTRCRWRSTNCRSSELLGCFAEGETVVTGAGELRLKESDRIAGVVDALNGLGGDAEATADGFVVRGTGGLRGGVVHSHGDHRMAMLGAVAGLASRDGVEVVGMDAAAVSYPGFLDDLATLR